jgi:predicted ester cyclase
MFCWMNMTSGRGTVAHTFAHTRPQPDLVSRVAEGNETLMATTNLDTLYCQFIDSLNRRQLTHLSRYLTLDIVQHAPEAAVGIGATRQTLVDWLAAFPDLHLLIDDLVVDADHLMARLLLTGTHRGPLAGLQPTGRRVRVVVFDAWRARNGRCAERWLQLDRLELLRQLQA